MFVEHVTAQASPRDLVGLALFVLVPPGAVARHRFPWESDPVWILVLVPVVVVSDVVISIVGLGG